MGGILEREAGGRTPRGGGRRGGIGPHQRGPDPSPRPVGIGCAPPSKRPAVRPSDQHGRGRPRGQAPPAPGAPVPAEGAPGTTAPIDRIGPALLPVSRHRPIRDAPDRLGPGMLNSALAAPLSVGRTRTSRAAGTARPPAPMAAAVDPHRRRAGRLPPRPDGRPGSRSDFRPALPNRPPARRPPARPPPAPTAAPPDRRPARRRPACRSSRPMPCRRAACRPRPGPLEALPRVGRCPARRAAAAHFFRRPPSRLRSTA